MCRSAQLVPATNVKKMVLFWLITTNVSAVNIEENGKRYPVPYVVPPGIEREINIATTDIIRRNEQSMVLKVDNLDKNDVFFPNEGKGSQMPE